MLSLRDLVVMFSGVVLLVVCVAMFGFLMLCNNVRIRDCIFIIITLRMDLMGV